MGLHRPDLFNISDCICSPLYERRGAVLNACSACPLMSKTADDSKNIWRRFRQSKFSFNSLRHGLPVVDRLRTRGRDFQRKFRKIANPLKALRFYGNSILHLDMKDMKDMDKLSRAAKSRKHD